MLFSFQEVYIQKALFGIATLVCSLLLSYILKSSVDLIFSRVKDRFSNSYVMSKTRTVRSIIKNAVDMILFVLAILLILSNWGVNITPILTGAGIIGLAFSFGSQTLVKDWISGFFILIENQFNVGDRVKIGTAEGNVYKMTLRLTILKDDQGNRIYIPNSQITTVVRYIK